MVAGRNGKGGGGKNRFSERASESVERERERKKERKGGINLSMFETRQDEMSEREIGERREKGEKRKGKERLAIDDAGGKEREGRCFESILSVTGPDEGERRRTR